MIRWTHITITVSQMERSVEFYNSMCKLEIVRDRRREGGGTVWLGYEPEAQEDPAFVLVLMEGEVTDRLDHFGFQCDSRDEVDRIAEAAAAREILVYAPTDSGGSVGYWTIIRDPDGHMVEFTFGQPLKGLS
ncbi:MAG TPA: VOC family protein [Pyrinomonadaceae bacterium]|jgi:catechol 2,3-dioxygenase-like lactoylglutathione lyase family enzyme